MRYLQPGAFLFKQQDCSTECTVLVICLVGSVLKLNQSSTFDQTEILRIMKSGALPCKEL